MGEDEKTIGELIEEATVIARTLEAISRTIYRRMRTEGVPGADLAVRAQHEATLAARRLALIEVPDRG